MKWHRRRLDEATVSIDGRAVMSPLRTLYDLAESLKVPDLVAVADALLRDGMCSLEELNALRGVRGQAHRDALRRVAQLADAKSWSPRESIIRVAMIEAGLPRPECNGEVIDGGIWIGVGDWLWREFRVIADYDGDHHDKPKQRHHDAQTRDDYADAGWRHLALTKKMSIGQMIMRVRRALVRAGWVA